MKETNNADLLGFAKSRAKKLRAHLGDLGHAISHSNSLEAIAKMEGFKDWNTYTARFKLAVEAAKALPQGGNSFPLHVGERISGTYRGSAFDGTLLGLEATINPAVWRAKIHFDTPVLLEGTEMLKLTRQRVRLMLDSEGRSVNLKGRPDGFALIDL